MNDADIAAAMGQPQAIYGPDGARLILDERGQVVRTSGLPIGEGAEASCRLHGVAGCPPEAFGSSEQKLAWLLAVDGLTQEQRQSWETLPPQVQEPAERVATWADERMAALRTRMRRGRTDELL